MTDGFLDDEQKEWYLAIEGSECPFCQSKKMKHGAKIFKNKELTQHVECKSCEKVWFDVYSLSDIVTAAELGL